LAISKKLVELMDGKIWIESEEGLGTKFFFTVCFSNGTNSYEIIKDPNIINLSNDIEPSKRPKILIVEDDKISRIIIMKYLQKNGIDIESARNGKEALSILSNSNFDIILMDVQMPIMDGLTTTKIIRDNEKGSENHIPIIAITAYAMKEDKEKCLKAGMDDYIAKPVDLEFLIQLINKWFDKGSLRS
jgi:CheY-like chemotaxis protein